ncbi:MAG: SDR family oxidoreductase [Phycisphaerales bacterium]|nr:SDR family oxidoreductase [Phycisphaerales bacterium]
MNQPDTPVAIVTGASSGIGEAVCRRLAHAGWRLVMVARNRQRLEAAADRLAIGSRAMLFPADVGDLAALDELVRCTLAGPGRIDAVVNNAGVAPLAPINELTGAELERVYRVNAIGPAHLIARAWPAMTDSGRGGCIVNVSTMGTRDPFPGFFAYAASKAAVNLMAQSCAAEGAAHGIRAFAVAPGAVETPMLRALFDETAIPPDACLDPDDVAAVIVDCITGRRDADNGATIFV